MEQALTKVARRPVQVLFTPHLVPTTRGILATCYARPADAGLVDRAPARALPRVLRRRSVRRRRRRAVGNEGDVRRQRRARHRALRRPHRHRRRDRGRGQPREGSVGPDDPSRELVARPARDDRPPARSGSSRDVRRHRGARVRRGRARVRDQGVGRSRPRARRHRRPRAGRRGRRVHDATSRRPRRCRSRAAHLADGHAAAVVLSSGNANAATGEPGRRDAPRMCELTGDGPRHSRPPTCSCARPASSGSRCRWPRSRPASRSCAARSAADGGGRRGAGDA